MRKTLSVSAFGAAMALTAIPVAANAGCEQGDLYCSANNQTTNPYEVVRNIDWDGRTVTLAPQGAPVVVSDHPAVSYAYSGGSTYGTGTGYAPRTSRTYSGGSTYGTGTGYSPGGGSTYGTGTGYAPRTSRTYGGGSTYGTGTGYSQVTIPAPPKGMCPVQCSSNMSGIPQGGKVLACYTVCKPAPKPPVIYRPAPHTHRTVTTTTTYYYYVMPPAPRPCHSHCGPTHRH